MKKQLLVLSCLLLIACMLHAQKDQSRFLVELSVGPSFPLGKFADKEVKAYNDNDPSGLAKTGIGANATIGYHLNKLAGLLLTAGYSVNKQDETGYHDFFSKTWYPGAASLDVSTGSWKIVKIMAGGFMLTPLTSENELSLVTKLSAGICKTAVPRYSYTAYGQGGSFMASGYQEKTKLPWAFCYQISVGLQYRLNNKLHVLFDVSSFNATATQKYSYNPNPISSGPVEWVNAEKKIRLGSVNARAGIGIEF